jgi:PAS domain S-box-containing protein
VKDIFRRSNIATKLTLLFWFVAAVPLLMVLVFTYFLGQKQLKEEEIKKLRAIAESRAVKIETYTLDMKKSIAVLASMPEIIGMTEKLAVLYKEKGFLSQEYAAVADEMRPFLSRYKAIRDFYDLFIISNDGDVVFSFLTQEDPEANLKKPPYDGYNLAKVFNSSAALVESRISAFEYYPPNKRYAAFITAPVIKNGRMIGIAALELENREVSELAKDYTGLGMTGEILIGQKIENKVVFVAPTRNAPAIAFNKYFDIGADKDLPIVRAATGSSGEGLAKDYRGKAVLSVWRYLPSVAWGLVVQIDAREEFEAVNTFKNILIVIGIIAPFLIILTARIISGSMATPIRSLQRGTEIISSGFLDYKVGTDAEDEIGQLSRAFDKMTDRLKNTTTSVDKLNKEITERKKVEAALKESREYLDKVINSIPDPIFVKDREHRWVLLNDDFCSFIGHKREELLGKTDHDIFPQGQAEIFWKTDEDVFVSGAENINEEILTDARGSSRTIVTKKALYVDRAGGAFIVGMIRDITESKNAEKAVKEAMMIKSDFISMVSHELRTPLGPIKEGVGIILDGLTGDVNKEQRDLLETVKRNADRLARLINNVLDFQKLESGKMPFFVQENDIAQVVDDVYRTMLITARGKGLDIVIKVEQGLPKIKFDKDKIEQVLTNLVNNAIKFTEKGVVTIKAHREGNGIHVKVEDTGPGIKDEDIPKLFQSFRQLDLATQKGLTGTGLGLAISKEIVSRHGGRIWAESDLGKGASFHFLLPVADRKV